MKAILFLLLSAFATCNAQTISDASNPDAVSIQTADSGTVNAGCAKDVAANYPALKPALASALKARLDADVANSDPLSALVRVKRLQAQGYPVPAPVVTAVTNAVEAMRAQKEAALITVAATDPERANAKLNQLLARGLPITKATQDAVRATLPKASPTPTPTPEPKDGL